MIEILLIFIEGYKKMVKTYMVSIEIIDEIIERIDILVGSSVVRR